VFLTQFEINRARRGAKKLLGSPQAMHAAVLAGFPADEGGRVLWRVDAWAVHTHLYVLSARPPDLTHLVEQAGWPTTHTWRTGDYRPVVERIADGDRYGFRLTANPTRSTKVHEGRRSQRVGHVTAEQQLGWLLDRADRIGVDFGGADEPTVRVVERAIRSFRRGDSIVSLSTATFEGTLSVASAGALRAAITSGIGPAKGYGCGLLTLAPTSAAAEALERS
jgi:CRISPR system Cascade subunit CasE